MATQSTKEKLSYTYLQLLKTKDADKITVKDVFTACGISRQTFYYYFQDLMDLVEYTLRGILDDLVGVCSKMSSPEDAIHLSLETAFKYRSMIRKLENSSRQCEIRVIVTDALHKTMADILNNTDSAYRIYTKQDRELLLDFMTYGFLGIVLTNLYNKDFDIDYLSQQVYRIYKGELKFF